jgi:chitinase
VEQAVAAAHTQVQAALKRSGTDLASGAVWQRMGVTVMLGQNDVAGEVFTIGDARGLVRFAQDHDLARVSMWSLNRDNQCGQAFGENGVLSDSCSGVAQEPLDFSTIFSALNGTPAGLALRSGIVVPPPDTNPANDLYPQWSPTAEYPAGYKVVRDGYIYQAKWYVAGEDPAQVWPSESEDPWELLGPVLRADHAPNLPLLPSGTFPAWAPTGHYQAGDRVLYQGLAYQAKWYNQGTSPGEEAADPFGSPWQPLFTLPGEPGTT